MLRHSDIHRHFSKIQLFTETVNLTISFVLETKLFLFEKKQKTSILTRGIIPLDQLYISQGLGMYHLPHQKSSGQPHLLQWGDGRGGDGGQNANRVIISIFSTPARHTTEMAAFNITDKVKT